VTAVDAAAAADASAADDCINLIFLEANEEG